MASVSANDNGWVDSVRSINPPELYPENLDALKKVCNLLPAISSVDGVFAIEVRVKVDDVYAWAVIGYGESGDPCVLRFESGPW